MRSACTVLVLMEPGVNMYSVVKLKKNSRELNVKSKLRKVLNLKSKYKTSAQVSGCQFE